MTGSRLSATRSQPPSTGSTTTPWTASPLAELDHRRDRSAGPAEQRHQPPLGGLVPVVECLPTTVAGDAHHPQGNGVRHRAERAVPLGAEVEHQPRRTGRQRLRGRSRPERRESQPGQSRVVRQPVGGDQVARADRTEHRGLHHDVVVPPGTGRRVRGQRVQRVVEHAVYRSIAGIVGLVSRTRLRSRSAIDFGPSFNAVRAEDSSELTERAAVITAARSVASSGNESAPRSRVRSVSPPSRFVSDGGRRTVSPVRTPARPAAPRS